MGAREVEAAFPRESYRPGETAPLRIWTATGDPVSLRVLLIGREPSTRPAETAGLGGTPVTPWRRLGAVRAGQQVRVRIGDWPSGLYFAQLRSVRGIASAPFVVAPRRLGENRVAIVLPTRTWQAYNKRDDDGDGIPDTWYGRDDLDDARLGRPYRAAGVPSYFRFYDLPFLQWVYGTGRAVDVLAQEDLDETTGARLARAYKLLVFPGHHEYVTEAEYDAVTAFRNRGGNLMFLSANNFFWRIDVHDGVMTRVARWRTLKRPEARLLGVQYIGSGQAVRGSWRVTRSAPNWLFADVPLRRGRSFSSGGIEVDARAASSPPRTRVVATIPNVLGRGKSAHMTYYELRGAKVFSAGAFTLAGSVRQPPVQQLLTNLWNRLARTVDTASGLRPPSPARRLEPPDALRGRADRLRQYPSLRLASQFERAEAARLLEEMKAVAKRWRDPRAAARAGFDTRRPKRRPGETRVMWFHSESRRNHSDDAYFDPNRPDTLIYADSPGRPLSLVGFMFSMPRGLEGATPGGPITRWHWHEICTNTIRRGVKPPEHGPCPRGTRLYGGSEMLHVWFTGDLRSAYAIHAPVHELCKARLVPPDGCKAGHHSHGM